MTFFAKLGITEERKVSYLRNILYVILLIMIITKRVNLQKKSFGNSKPKFQIHVTLLTKLGIAEERSVSYSRDVLDVVINHDVNKENFQANIYLVNFNNRNTRKRCKICSKLTIKSSSRLTFT